LTRLAIVASHPIQYQAPYFRELARNTELYVLFAHKVTPHDQSNAGFGVDFVWDIDLTGGLNHTFLENIAVPPGLDRYAGCDTPNIGRELANGKFDCLLVMGWHLKCYWQAIWAAKRLGLPAMVRGDSHLLTPRSLIKRAAKATFYPFALRAFDAALYVGERSKRYWQHYNYPCDRMFFSPHCVDNAWFAKQASLVDRAALRAEWGIAPRTKVVLFAGKLLPAKRPQDVVEAVGMLNRGKAAKYAVLVAGAGILEPELGQLAGQQDVQLVQLGFCNQSRMPAVYAASDMLCLPSSHETWGLVANEALACGRPIIVSETCGCAPDLASEATAGLTVPLGDTHQLARAIEQTAQSPPSAEGIAAKAAAYSPHAAAYGTLEAMRNILNRQRNVGV